MNDSLNLNPKSSRSKRKGNLRIGDHWNAIHIIALSQSNPLKAIAEFVENSIDAKAKTITIVRGKEGGKHYLRIVDDGVGIPKNEQGIPDFKYVAIRGRKPEIALQCAYCHRGSSTRFPG